LYLNYKVDFGLLPLADTTWSGNCTSGEQTLSVVYLCKAQFYEAIKFETDKKSIFKYLNLLCHSFDT